MFGVVVVVVVVGGGAAVDGGASVAVLLGSVGQDIYVEEKAVSQCST